MTIYVNPVLGEELFVYFANTVGNATTYSHPVVINGDRSSTFTVEYESDVLANVTDPSKIGQTFRRAKSIDFKVDGGGQADANSVLLWAQWWADPTPRQMRVTDGNYVIDGLLALSSFQHSGTPHKASSVQITLEQAAPLTVSAAE